MRYLAISGGADSTAMALLLHERGEDFEMVFSDTGAELPETYCSLLRLEHYTGRRLHTVTNGTFEEHLEAYDYLLPSVRQRWCTRILKEESQKRFFAANPGSCGIGIRADEAHRVKGMQSRMKQRDFFFPLVEAGLAKRDVRDLCRKHDLLSAAYNWRSNTSCFCCPFQRISDWRGLLRYHPDLFALAEQWEIESRIRAERKGVKPYTWKSGHTLTEMRTATERQLEFWPETEEELCTVCHV